MALAAPALWGSCRLVLTGCVFLALLNCFVQRFSLSFAVVCMVRQPPASNNTGPADSTDQEGQMDWDRLLTEWLLSAYFYGYLASQLATGLVSDRHGGKAPFVFGNTAQSLLALLLPIAATWRPSAVFAVRLLQGVACGFFMPAIFKLLKSWTLPSERTSLLAFAYVSVPLSFIITFPLSGFICHYASWPFVFYVTGVFGAACSLLTYFLVYDTPERHPRISESERAALRAVTPPESKEQAKVPLRAMLLSGPLNANFVANFCYNWGFNTVATNLPIFLEEVLEVDVRQNGVYSALPYVGLLCMRLMIAAGFMQCMKVTGLGLTAFRKLNHTIGAVGAGACVLGLVSLPSSSKMAAVALVAASQTVSELTYTGGFLGSFFDLAPSHVGLLSGWTNALGAATGLLGPAVIGILASHGTRDEWDMVLYITAGFYLLGAVVYLLFGSSETQQWDAGACTQMESEKQPLLAMERRRDAPLPLSS